MPLRGKQPHERVCLQTGGARCAPPSARPAALPLLQLCLLCAGAGFICPGHVSFDADFSFYSVGRGLDPSAELPKNACRGEHCPPVPVCLARKPSRKMRCGGKWAGDQWSPPTHNKAGMQFFDGLRSGQDRSLQISRQRRGGYNKVGGNKKSHHGRWWEKFRLCFSLIIWQLHTFLCHRQALPCKCKFCPLPCR